jgi:hypothetical protein
MREVATKEFTAKRDAFEHDWERDLQHLLPTSNEITFDEAWRVTTEVVAQFESLGLKN